MQNTKITLVGYYHNTHMFSKIIRIPLCGKLCTAHKILVVFENFGILFSVFLIINLLKHSSLRRLHILAFPEQRTSLRMLSSLSEWRFWSLISRLNRVPCLSNPGCPSTSSNSERLDLHEGWRRRFFGDITINGLRKSRWICHVSRTRLLD